MSMRNASAPRSGDANHRGEHIEPHRVSVDTLMRHYACARDGLTQHEAAERLRHDGRNILPEPARPSLASRLARHLAHPFALLLWAGAGLALMGERFSPGEGMALISGALVTVVLINALFSFLQEIRVERAMAAFRNMLSRRARVLRDGAEREVDAAEVVAGDVIVLREGDRVAADARLFETHALKVDNSPLTGECEPQLRTTAPASGSRLDSRNLVFSGTLVTTGTGKALVYATGSATEIGQIAGVTLETRRIETPIRREIRHFVRVISIIAIVLGLVFFAAGWAVGNPLWINLVFAIGIIVANVPEGLLPTVTLALAIAGRKMAKRKALLKTLESAETLGCTTIICTDKTGTLTQNDMRVTELVLAGESTPWAASRNAREELDGALRVMSLCNNATLERSEGRVQSSGDPTETALLLYVEALEQGMVSRLRGFYARVHEHPFDSATREMATVNAGPEGLEVVNQCVRLVRRSYPVEMSDELQRSILATANGLARSGKRVLALARKSASAGADLDAEALGGGYEFVGLVAMHDPPRPEVAGAVVKCRMAGIRLIVVSGDHPLTVEAIAREVGIADACSARTGDDLAHLSKAALRHALEDDGILFARTSPRDKLRIVAALQEMGHVVAVTGDGVNDAPALKRADIGIAMGQTGTDVAREAADMVLMDDNFATIVAAIEEGRVIYANIRRFVGYVLTSNVPEILPYVAFVLLAIPLPLPVLLVLAIDLGTDMAPAIALATETAETDVMRLAPRSPAERLLSRELLLSSVLWGLFEAAAGFAAYSRVLLEGGWTPGMRIATASPLYGRAIGAFFAAVVICQVANVLLWRTTHESILRKGLLRNRAVLVGVLVELALLFVIVETQAGHEAFGTASQPPSTWLVPLPFALSMLALSELLKGLARRKARGPKVRSLYSSGTGAATSAPGSPCNEGPTRSLP